MILRLFFVWLVMVSSSRSSGSNSSCRVQVHGLSTSSPVAVIGGTGRLGRQVVQQLVDQGTPCHMLVRKLPDKDAAPPSSLKQCTSGVEVAAYFQSKPQVTLHQGDVGDVKALENLVQDCFACLALWGATRRSKVSDLFQISKIHEDPTHAKQVNYQGLVNLIDTCEASKSCKRIVRITGKGEDPNGFFSLLINLLGSMAKAWNYQGEQALRASKIDYTIIRPGVMSEDKPEDPPRLVLADDGEDLPVAPIRYRDIASLCVESLQYDNTARCTLTAMTAKDENSSTVAEKTWAPLLAGVKADRRQFPADMLEQHYAAVRSLLLKLAGAGTAIVAVAVKSIFF